MEINLLITKDGSHTLFRPDINETYHSSFGAIQESMHIFINSGLLVVNKKQIQVFEVGFGTGLNALLSCIISEKNELNISYYGIEKFPVNNELIGELNFPQLLNGNSDVMFNEIHAAEWNRIKKIGNFSLYKIEADITNYPIPFGNDVVYFDAFSPEKEPGLWTVDVFEKVYNSMNFNGIFVTYSAKGSVRRMLTSLGFRVEKLEGPPGKKHILRAIK